MLLVTAVSSIILGMGMPTTVTYIILISMLATPLVEFGIPLLAAHLFILYFGVIADITPPVAVARRTPPADRQVRSLRDRREGVLAVAEQGDRPLRVRARAGIVLLREKANAADLPIREQYRVVGFADLAELSYSVPEILIPIAGVLPRRDRSARPSSGHCTRVSAGSVGPCSPSARCC